MPEIDRVEFKRLKENFCTVLVQYGFMDEPDIPEALAICEKDGLDISPLDATYFLGRETLIPRLNSELAFWREKIYIAMFRNADSATAYFKIPSTAWWNWEPRSSFKPGALFTVLRQEVKLFSVFTGQ